MTRLPPRPELEWSADGAPRARAFRDVYFSDHGGLAESEAVFLHGCGLPELWYNKSSFAICELGFGTGLNILAAWRAWKKTRSPHALLHISSIEACPLEVDVARRALERYPEVADLAAALLECWPVRAYAPQRFWFAQDGFSLTLHTGEAEAVLAGLDARFDAWFLDGFAPSRNPTMWSETVFAEIARLSAPSARLATFTVAGAVRRGLTQAGFEIEKKPGFGSKRERLEGRFGGPDEGRTGELDDALEQVLSSAHPHKVALPSSRDSRPSPQRGEGREGGRAGGTANGAFSGSFCTPPPPAPAPRGGGRPARELRNPPRVAIIGAGIAGAACARALLRRGVETVVLDAAPALGACASGNPAGIVMPRLDRGGVLREFFLAAYLHAVREYETLGAFLSRGVEIRVEARAAAALADLLADPPLPPDWFAPVGDASAFHVRAGLIDVRAAITRMLVDAEFLLEAPVETLERVGDGWALRGPDGRVRLTADAVVLACGAGLARFAPAAFLPIELSRGQIEWGQGAAPPHAITRGSYLAPYGGGVLFGATFDPADASIDEHEARQRNFAALAALAPEVAASVTVSALTSRAALRATMPDFAPVAGLLPDADAWLTQNAKVAHGGPLDAIAPSPAHEGMYVLGGLGARGLTFAPLLGEHIASLMLGEPPLLSRAAAAALAPARFLLRAARRGSG